MGCRGGCRPGVSSPHRGSIGFSAEELCPWCVRHWSCASQPPQQDLVCPQTADCPPYEDSVCSSSCTHRLGHEYCIGFTEEYLNTASNRACPPKEGKRGCLNSPIGACRDVAWRQDVLQGEGASQRGGTRYGHHSVSRNRRLNTKRGQEQEIWDLHPPQHLEQRRVSEGQYLIKKKPNIFETNKIF